MCMCVCACVCVHRCVCVYIEKSFSSVHLHISRLMPKPYPLPVLQERLEKPVINREEPHKCSGFVSLRLKHSSPNESAGNYCSSAALQSTRCRHTRVECTTLQKKKRDPLPPACMTTCTGKAASLRGFPGCTKWVFAAPYLQELLDPEGAVVLLSIWCGPFWWLFWAETTLLIPPKTERPHIVINNSHFLLRFLFSSLTVHCACQDQALNYQLSPNPACPWADVAFWLHFGQERVVISCGGGPSGSSVVLYTSLFLLSLNFWAVSSKVGISIQI